jgi:hypothetical protein
MYCSLMALQVKYSEPWQTVVCPVSVDGPERVREALVDVAAAVFEPTPGEDELVVLRSEVGVIRVDEHVEVVGVGALEVRHQLPFGIRVLLVPDRLAVGGHGSCDLGVA